VEHFSGGMAGRIAVSLENGGNALLHLGFNVEQRWSKVEQRRGLCSTFKGAPLKGVPSWKEVEHVPTP